MMAASSTVKQRVRIAIVGAGRMANNAHYPSLATCDDVDIAGICDLNPAALHATADKYGITGRYADYRQMVAEVAPDGVFVIGPPHVMYEIWVWCLQEGLNLYVEKPMGTTMHQAHMLANLAAAKGVITQVSQQRRTHPLLNFLRNKVLEHGPVVHAVCEFYKHGPAPRPQAWDHVLDDSVHAIDTVRWMCGGGAGTASGAEVVEVESRCKRIGTPNINWVGATLHFSNGATGYVLNSWSSGRRVLRVQMHAEGIAADANIDTDGTLYTGGDTKGTVYDARTMAGSDKGYIYGGFRAKHREFIDSIKTGQDVTSSPFRDNIKTMEVAQKILAQALLRGE